VNFSSQFPIILFFCFYPSLLMCSCCATTTRCHLWLWCPLYCLNCPHSEMKLKQNSFETVLKRFRNRFETVLKRFCFISLCGQFNGRRNPRHIFVYFSLHCTSRHWNVVWISAAIRSLILFFCLFFSTGCFRRQSRWWRHVALRHTYLRHRSPFFASKVTVSRSRGTVQQCMPSSLLAYLLTL